MLLQSLFLIPALTQAPQTSVTEPAPEPPPVTRPPTLEWLDFDADGDPDAFVLEPDGRLRLLVNGGAGELVEESERFGLAEVSGVARLLAGDWNLDGRTDLVLTGRRGLRLLRGDGAGFVERTPDALRTVGPVVALRWVDADVDGRPDLHVVTEAGRHRVWSSRPDGTFEELLLGLPAAAAPGGQRLSNADGHAPSDLGSSAAPAASNVPKGGGPESAGDPDEARDLGTGRGRVSPGASGGGTLGVSVSGPAVSGATVTSAGTATDLAYCPASLEDQSGGDCVQASSVPALGMLYPLGTELFIDASTGNVGLGTLTPSYTLEVVGKIVSGTSNTSSGLDSAVGGGSSNVATGERSAIAGGVGNRTGYRAAVGGGDNNRATGNLSTVSGGKLNDALQTAATIGGGEGNAVDATHATVAGGESNTASGSHASVGGGHSNLVTADYGTVPGGQGNVSAGAYSHAAGRRARAVHDGAFVWADSEDADFTSTEPDQFLVRADGGAGFGTDDPRGSLEVVGSVRSSGAGASFTCYNPNDEDATASLNWLNDVARIRIGGGGAGAQSGLDIQTVTDTSLMRIRGNGRVGIGTTSPDAGLHVTEGSSLTLGGGGYLQAGSSSSSNVAIDQNEIMARSNGSGANLYLNRLGGDVYLTSNQAGRVGVGTIGPDAQLEVRGGGPGVPVLKVRGDDPDATIGLLSSFEGHGPALYGASETASGTAYGVLGHSRSQDGYGGFFQNLGGGAAGLFSGRVRIEDGSAVTLLSGGYLQIGRSSSQNIAMDGNEIMARSNGSTSSLTLNANGGNVRFFPNGSGRLDVGSDLRIYDDMIEARGTSFSVLSDGALGVEADATVDVSAGAGMVLDSATTLDVDAGTTMTMSSQGQISMTSPLITTNGVLNHNGPVSIGGNLTVNGSIIATTCTCAPSDARWKTQVETLQGALETVTRLRGTSYRWNDDAPADDDDLQYGFIAQEVAEVLPDIVKDHPDGEHYTVAYHQVIPILTEALSELRDEKDAELDALRARVDALEQELERSRDVTRDLVERFERATSSGGTARSERDG